MGGNGKAPVIPANSWASHGLVPCISAQLAACAINLLVIACALCAAAQGGLSPKSSLCYNDMHKQFM